ncbi:MAG: ABC transporter ATP-binding protein/permease [Desulfobulbus sp.]|jgi:ATP-binding cassette subfamily B protein|uniref:ABC transporter ATP-binding protein n=1 Tax=Desulfobulbus sp. TaxID=895 RepID=UPI00283E627A|nr:ABC transporter ATP-binding protein [Desulfobulbus sp.]MDR2549238.1 ABC transporter ATP-binding protein/permease [Desulfobulbus sp.]
MRTTKKKTGIARLLEIADAKRRLLMLACCLAIVSSLLMLTPFLSAYHILRELLRHAADPSANDVNLLLFWAIAAFVALLAALALLYASAIASHYAAFDILYNLRIRLAQHLAALPMGFHTRESIGTIRKTLEVNVEKIESFIAHQLPDLAGAVSLPLLMLAGMFVLDWRLALACTLPIVAAFVMQAMVFQGQKAREHTRQYHDALEKMNAAGVEYVRGMPAVKVFGITVRSFLGFHAAIEGYREQAEQISRTYKHPYTLFFVILSSILAFVLPTGLYLLGSEPDPSSFAVTLLLFLVMAPGLPMPVLKLLNIGGNLRMIAEGVERIDALFAMVPLAEPARPTVPRTHAVAFDAVHFSYAGADDVAAPEALAGVSFVAEENTVTALVGPSGSGKSTIANLIPRFWDVGSGAIRIGGVDIREIGTAQLMDTVSFVFQDVHLFHDTIEENIRMGRPDIGREQVVAAAKAARCHEFISALPDGYATRIGEGGTYLSGGEGQRLAIARALLKNAPILVLDEATAFADPENEALIQQGINSLIKGKTVLVIAHRLASIREADQILVMDRGRIAERGRHEELLAAQGLYRRMWEAYTDAEAWHLPAKESDAIKEAA